MAALKEEKFSRVTPREDFRQHAMCVISLDKQALKSPGARGTRWSTRVGAGLDNCVHLPSQAPFHPCLGICAAEQGTEAEHGGAVRDRLRRRIWKRLDVARGQGGV